MQAESSTKIEKGIPQNELTVTGTTRKSGTTIQFWPDAEIFETVDFQFDILSKRFKELAYLNPRITISFEDERNGKKEP